MFFPRFLSQDIARYENKHDVTFLQTNIQKRIVRIKLMFQMFQFFCDANISKLHKLQKHSTMKKTVTMSLYNYFKRQTKSENETRVQIAAAQVSLTNIEETEVHDVLQSARKKQQLSTKNKTR